MVLPIQYCFLFSITDALNQALVTYVSPEISDEILAPLGVVEVLSGRER